jgi:4-amino-4-deoxy-L-arabinose transferase-like glycosyltransferase
LSTLTNFPGFSSFFISWVIAVLYSLFGQSELMGQSLSLFFGMGSVYLGWLLTKKVWNQRAADKAGWFLALFPTLILYSCLILREAYVVFFLLIALNGIVDWTRTNKFKSLIFVIIGFIGATLFHGGMIFGFIVFSIIIFLQSIIIFYRNLINLKINLRFLIITICTIIIATSTLVGTIVIPKIGNVGTLTDFDRKIWAILDQIKNVNKGIAKYPSWAVPSSKSEILFKSPIRMVYFVFSPFPWDIKKFNHLIGLLDAILYMFLSYLIFQNRKIILADPALKIILIILFTYILIYGLGSGNFGTSIRHRSKFVVIFILLAAPLLPKFIFYLKNKKTKKVNN